MGETKPVHFVPPQRGSRGARGTPKGRPVDPQAAREVRALVGDAPRRRDLLIEHLHRIQDRYGSISAAHLNALAAEMKLSAAEVYEVATFYHHFDVIKEGEASPPAITVRVCDSLACEMAGARRLLSDLAQTLGANVRVITAPCVGRCDEAPVAIVGQRPVARANVEAVQRQVERKAFACPVAKYIDYDQYRANGGY